MKKAQKKAILGLFWVGFAVRTVAYTMFSLDNRSENTTETLCITIK